MKIVAAKKIVAANDAIAAGNRARLRAANVFTVNLLGSPGAGKTTLLESLSAACDRLAVIEGDLATARDAQRIEKLGVPVVQVNTGGGCHLDANMVASALAALELDKVELLFIENVGNLVCTAGFDLGEDLRAVVLSVTEGDDKIAKYPPIFQRADAVVFNKIDLLPHTDFSLDRALADLKRLAPQAEVFKVAARTGDGVAAFATRLRQRMER
jgi:hydrogenase nickel incorporation protein HypB